MSIQPIGFLETDAFQATFVLKYRSLLSADLNGVDTLLLRTATEDTPLLAEWKAAKTLLTKIRNGASRFLGGEPAELGCVEIQRFKPQTATPWRIDEDNGCFRLHLGIIPSPDMWVMSGAARSMVAVGSLVLIDHQILHCETNFADHPAVHLVVDVKRPNAD